MQICKVICNIWATQKEASLQGSKLMIVRPEASQDSTGFVAADLVGAGIGEVVLVVTGSTARAAFSQKPVYIDAAIVGIVDQMEAN